jgi:hypothetical protein
VDWKEFRGCGEATFDPWGEKLLPTIGDKNPQIAPPRLRLVDELRPSRPEGELRLAIREYRPSRIIQEFERESGL